MKKVLIALGLVVVMSFSAFAVSMELMNIISGTGNDSVTAQGAALGVGFDVTEDIEVVVGYASYANAADKSKSDSDIILKGYYDLGVLRVGLQITSITNGVTETSVSPMALLVGKKITLVDGVDLVIDGIIYETNGAADPADRTAMLSAGGTIGISLPIM